MAHVSTKNKVVNCEIIMNYKMLYDLEKKKWSYISYGYFLTALSEFYRAITEKYIFSAFYLF